MSETNIIKKYRGNCHCGAFVFEIEVPEIKSATACNCSICVKKGYLWVKPHSPPTIIKGEGTLARYGFGGKNIEHFVRFPPLILCRHWVNKILLSSAPTVE